jgi:protein ImuA
MNIAMHAQPDSLRRLRQELAQLEGHAPPGGRHGRAPVPTGHDGIDQALGGGIGRGRLHELLVAAGDAGSGSGFAALLARLLGGEILWLREEAACRQAGTLNPVGLAAIGLSPARLILAVLPDAALLLRAAADGLRCPALGAVVIELSGSPGALDLSATRRLTLAAEASGVTPLLLRLGGTAFPNAAQTRWQVAAAPSTALAADAPGHPAWEIALLRQRGRPDGGRWRVEWSRDEERLHGERLQGERTQGEQARNTGRPAVPGAVVSLPFDRPAAAGLSFIRAA